MIAAVSMLVGLVTIARHPGAGISYFVIAFVFVLTPTIGTQVFPRRWWKSEPFVRQSRIVHFDNDGVRSAGELQSISLPWPSIHQISTLNDLYIFWSSSGRSLLTVPRRAFASESDEQAFRALSSRMVTTTYFGGQRR